MKLLLLNAFKGLKKKKIQMLGIVFLVLLSTAVYTGMNSAIDRLEDKYYSYLDEQNVEDITVGVNIDLTKDFKPSDVDEMLKTSLKNATEEEKQVIYAYREFVKNPNFDVNIIYSTLAILNKYNALEPYEMAKIEKYTKSNDFYYEKEYSKTVQNGKHLIKVLPYNKSKKLNKPYVIEGRLPKNDKEITMMPKSAKKNNLKIGDTYKINGVKYKIVGFTYAPDYIYPLVSLSMPIFDEKNNNVIYVYQDNYNNIVGINENSYSIRYNFNPDRRFKISASASSNSDEKTEKSSGPNYADPVFKIFNNKDDIVMDMSTILRITRIGELQLEFWSDRLFAEYFLYLLLGISVIIIIIITKKRIEDERLQIGVLKSLGYNKFSIAASYLVYPIIGSIIGGIIGFLIGNVISEPIATILRSYYAVPLSNYSINMKYLVSSILTPTIVLSLLSYIIALIMLRKKPLQLLREGSNLKVNLFSKLVNKITKPLPFNQRFKYSLAFRSMGKLFIVTITSFLTGLLLTLILIGMNIFNNVIDKTFGGLDYKYMAFSNGFNQIPGDDNKSDYLINLTMGLNSVEHKDGKVKKYKEDEQTFTINGIDTDSKYIKILNKKEKDIKSKLKDKNGAIVSRNIKENLKIDIGDTFTVKHEDLEVSYKVIDISEEVMGFGAYVNREGLNEKIGIPKDSYSTVYSTNEKYSEMSKLPKEEAEKIVYLMNLEDLKENIEVQMDRFNGSVYIIILFASVMALIIIMVIANIVVEENKKTISLMKVLGYENKRISKVILNIYTPFIVIAYLLSIPVMIQILKAIMKALMGDTEMAIPIEADPVALGIGLVGLLVAYYLALAFSKRVLNKIPLAIALKRE